MPCRRHELKRGSVDASHHLVPQRHRSLRAPCIHLPQKHHFGQKESPQRRGGLDIKGSCYQPSQKTSLAKFFHFPLLKLYQHLNFFKLTKGTPHRGPTPAIVGPPPSINQSQLPQKKISILCMCNSLLFSFLLIFNILISILPNTNSLSSSQFFQILVSFHPNSSKH